MAIIACTVALAALALATAAVPHGTPALAALALVAATTRPTSPPLEVPRVHLPALAALKPHTGGRSSPADLPFSLSALAGGGGGGVYRECAADDEVAQFRRALECRNCLYEEGDGCPKECCAGLGPGVNQFFLCAVGEVCGCVRILVSGAGGYTFGVEPVRATRRRSDGACATLEPAKQCGTCAVAATIDEKAKELVRVDCVGSGVRMPEYGDEYHGVPRCADGSIKLAGEGSTLGGTRPPEIFARTNQVEATRPLITFIPPASSRSSGGADGLPIGEKARKALGKVFDLG
jgi:hypothetical protein